MSLSQVIIVAVILLLCGILQGTVGFAFSLFCVPAMLLVGIRLPEAVMISLLCGTLLRVVTVFVLHESIPWKKVWPLAIVSALALPLGVAVLQMLAKIDKGAIRQVFGVLILTAIAVQWACRIKPRHHVHGAWGALAAACSGVLSGVANIGGPPIVMWVHAHDWPNETIRGTTLAVTLPMVPIQFALFLRAFGTSVFPPPAPAALWLAMALAGGMLGLSLGKRLPVPQLRIAAYGLLLLLCAAAIIEPMFK